MMYSISNTTDISYKSGYDLYWNNVCGVTVDVAINQIACCHIYGWKLALGFCNKFFAFNIKQMYYGQSFVSYMLWIGIKVSYCEVGCVDSQ